MMTEAIYYTDNSSPALEFAARELEMRGMTVVQEPDRQVTHLLLGVPCRKDKQELEELLAKVGDATVFGGFLDRQELAGYDCRDLLTDERYLSENAAITARCALRVALQRLPVTLDNCPVLILGWGRIGKCLSPLLKALGAQVVIALRNAKDRAMIRALGYEAETLPFPAYILPRFRVVFNTVPAPVVSAEDLSCCRKGCLKIELASSPGMEGPDLIDARGLPGRLAPESSGKLIARTVIRMSSRKEVSL